MQGKTVLIIFAGVLSAAAIAVTIYGAVGPAKPAVQQVQQSGSPAPQPSGGASPKAAASATSAKPFALDIKELKVKFDLTSGLHDLEYQVATLQGDTEVTTVGFGSKRLDAAGCPAGTAPLGYLTYDSDQGGTYLETINSEPMYYIEPTSSCGSDEVSSEGLELKQALQKIKSDGP